MIQTAKERCELATTRLVNSILDYVQEDNKGNISYTFYFSENPRLRTSVIRYSNYFDNPKVLAMLKKLGYKVEVMPEEVHLWTDLETRITSIPRKKFLGIFKRKDKIFQERVDIQKTGLRTPYVVSACCGEEGVTV